LVKDMETEVDAREPHSNFMIGRYGNHIIIYLQYGVRKIALIGFECDSDFEDALRVLNDWWELERTKVPEVFEKAMGG